VPDNLFRCFATAAARAAGPALVDAAGRNWSFADLDRRSATVAAALGEAGVRPGDRVLLQASAAPGWLVVYLACLRSGFVVVPVSADYGADELGHFLRDAAPRVAVGDAVTGPGLEAALAALPAGAARPTRDTLERLTALPDTRDPALAPEPAAHALAALLYSSGTTGQPKGARLSHANLVANATTLVAAWGFTPADRLLHALPLHHAHGLFVAIGTAWAAGATVLLRERFAAADVVAQLPGCTVLMGVPTHYGRLVDAPGLAAAARHLRLCVSGSAPLPAALHARFTACTGHAILERYGMTETLMLTSNPLAGERRPGSVGRPLPGVELRLGDGTGRVLAADATGEIEVRGPSVTSGYWGLPEQSAGALTPDGWFRTGDLGTIAPDGYVTIVGRSKDLVITGGLNVYPREVELVLDALPGVAESAVIGLPHPDFGEAVVAVVVPAPGTNTDPVTLQAAARERLAGYKAPKRVFVVPELPRNALGKVRKAALREAFRDTFLSTGDAA
jgi:malonyl-CoA/methylmalonyl-CoA synthetase